MKTGTYSLLYMIVSNLAIWVCFIPFLLMARRKMRLVRTYWIVGIYWCLNGLINLTALDFFRHFDKPGLQEHLNFYYTLLENPLVLLVFTCAECGRHRKQLLSILLLFITWELALVGWKGYNFSTSALIIGSGILLILAFSITGLVQYMKKMEHTPFENSMAFIYAALLFSYGSFLIIYIFAHMRAGSNANGSDSFLLYYISLLLSALITSLGLWSYGVRASGYPAYSSSSS